MGCSRPINGLFIVMLAAGIATTQSARPGGKTTPQQSPAATQTPTIRVESSLVLVDVITQDRKTGLPIRDLKKGDFRLFDNGREVRITTFDAGAQYDTRSITLWLVVICNEGGLPKFGASAEFLGQESLFRPALNHLEAHDRVGVAHWCDNGDSRLDLQPTEDRDKAIQQLAETLKPIPFEGGHVRQRRGWRTGFPQSDSAHHPRRVPEKSEAATCDRIPAW